MTSNFSKLFDRNFSAQKRLTTTVLLSVLLCAALSPFFSVVEMIEQTSEGLVYCPLSKKFQPINPPQARKQPFGNICASEKTKDFLVREIFIKNLSKRMSLEESSLDKLAFDFLAHGKSALENLPSLPDLPSENIANQINSNTAYNNYEYKFVWKQSAKIFSPELAPRPPTVQKKSFFARRPIYQTDELSDYIAPRAPPFLS